MSNLNFPISVLTEERDNIHGLPKSRADKLNRAIDILNEEKRKDEEKEKSKIEKACGIYEVQYK